VANNINISSQERIAPLRRQTSRSTKFKTIRSNNSSKTVPKATSPSNRKRKKEGYYPGSAASRRTPAVRWPECHSSRQRSGGPRSGGGRRAEQLTPALGNVHFFPQILKLNTDLDAPTAGVIEAKIVEVSSDFLEKLGVRWSPDGSKVFTRTILTTPSSRMSKASCETIWEHVGPLAARAELRVVWPTHSIRRLTAP